MHIPLVSPWIRYLIDIPNYESPDVPTRCYIWWFYLLGDLLGGSPFKPVHYFRGNSLITECLGDGVLFLSPLQYTRTVEVLNITACAVLVHIEGHSYGRGILCVFGCLCRVRLVTVLFRFLCVLFFYDVIVDLSIEKKRVLRVLRIFPAWSPRIQLVSLLVSFNCYTVMVT